MKLCGKNVTEARLESWKENLFFLCECLTTEGRKKDHNFVQPANVINANQMTLALNN